MQPKRHATAAVKAISVALALGLLSGTFSAPQHLTTASQTKHDLGQPATGSAAVSILPSGQQRASDESVALIESQDIGTPGTDIDAHTEGKPESQSDDGAVDSPPAQDDSSDAASGATEAADSPQPSPDGPGLDEEEGAATLPVSGANVCTPGRYYALDFRRGDGTLSPMRVAIHEATYNTATNQVSSSTQRTPDLAVDFIGGPNRDMGINSLGMTSEGVFYFTSQRNTGLTSRPYSVYKYEMKDGDITKPGTLTRVVDRGSNPANQAFVAGAVNPVNGDFYFGHYVNTKGSAGRSELHLYRHASGTNTAGKVGVFRTPQGMHIGDTWGNGDFAFNADGDLIYITSSTNPGNTGALTATIEASQIREATATPGVHTYEIPAGAVRTGLAMDSGSAFNGIAYTEQGGLIVEQGNNHRLKSSLTFENLTRSPSTIDSAVTLVDLASCFSPPTLEVTKNLSDRAEPQDQFELVAEWHKTENGDPQYVSSTTTSGDSLGVQAQKIGPTPVESNTWYTISERGAGGTDLGNYATNMECAIQGTNVPVTRISGSSFKVRYPHVTDSQGGALKCQVTNETLRPALKVEKRANPDSGTPVRAGQEVNYTIEFDNSVGTAPAQVSHTDHLQDVLDDATWVSGPSLVGKGLRVSSKDFDATTGQLEGQRPRLEIVGTIAAGQKVSVTYKVRVLPDISPRSETEESTAYELRNSVTKTGENPPESCEPNTNLCTEHPVLAWTVAKDSVPVSGSRVSFGEEVKYVLTVERLGHNVDIPNIVVTDDLTDVLSSASWVEPEGSPESPPDAASLGMRMPKPVFDASTHTWTSTSESFVLPKDKDRAIFTFSVRVGEPERADGWNPNPDSAGAVENGTEFTNTVTAQAEAPPAACATGVDSSFDPAACQVSHVFSDTSFDVVKLGDGRHSGSDEPVKLTGHEFELRADEGGEMSAEAPPNACSLPESPDAHSDDANGCWRFYQLDSGFESGTYKSRGLPPGSYWLLETRAPTHRVLDDGSLEAVSGIQLLAEPVKFTVGDEDTDFALDVLIPSNSGDLIADRCDVGGTSFSGTACVSPEGRTMHVFDPRLMTLPMTGANAVIWVGIGSVGLLALALLGVYLTTGKTRGRSALSGRRSSHSRFEESAPSSVPLANDQH